MHVAAALDQLQSALGPARTRPPQDTAREVLAELAQPDRLRPLLRELADGAGDMEQCAQLSYRHVLGFDKLLLLPGKPHFMLRAHVWRAQDGEAPPEDIHNHRCAIASYVLLGGVRMELYEEAEEGIAAAGYQETLEGPEEDWRLEPTGEARLRRLYSARHATGSSYALAAHMLHRATGGADGTAVTLFLETEGVQDRTRVFRTATSTARPERTTKSLLSVKEYQAELDALSELLVP
ncbi:hypothetical protein [Streptomyces beijiangensis]|uniref:Uncharacterized protein n=1 Tax=Streptomyces beijiangensis TaxID=163361 RepID=A0A939JLC2_9ACTN|nr:hypothetical protein [Streptomyces beijiangensis]MBO0516245.1 hypothetical protein [Streptomyces beijiangensis]